MESFLIFLDFDGVLHDAHGNLPLFAHVPALADALANFQEARIVVTSSWREHRNLEQLQTDLGLLGSRVIGVTPLLKECRQYVRHREIEAWLRERPEYMHWIALDDMQELFEPQIPNLLWCDPRTGLEESVMTALVQKLEKHYAA